MSAQPAKRRPFVFFGLVFAFATPFWVAGALVRSPSGAPAGLPVSALQFTAPMLAALVLSAREGGRPEVSDLLRRTVAVRGRRNALRIVGFALVPVAVYGSSYAVMRATGRPLPDPEYALLSGLTLVALFVVSATAEEMGWSAYALEPLAKRYGWLAAALLIGVVWAAFHIVPDLQGGHDLQWIVAHRTSATALRVVIVAAFLGTGGLVPAAIAVHAMDNISWTALPVQGSSYDPWVTAPLMIVAAAGTWFVVSRTWRDRQPRLLQGPSAE